MDIKPEELTTRGYQLDAALEHDQILPFITKYMKKLNPVTLFFWAWNVLLIVAFGIMLGVDKTLPLKDKIPYACMGVLLFMLVLIPIHEYIHGTVYSLQGAKKVQYRVQWKKMMVLAIADGFVANRKEFYRVAFSPFVVINSTLIVGILLSGGFLHWILFGALLFHTSGCVGDFGLSSYFYENRKRDVVTYDDDALKKSYFYSK